MAKSSPPTTPSSVRSALAHSHESGVPSPSMSAAPAVISQMLGMPSLLQSAWQESGVPFPSQSVSAPPEMSHESGMVLPLQSAANPLAISHESRTPLRLQSNSKP